MNNLTCRIKPYIRPFERQLAIRELGALASSPVVPLDGNDDTARTFAIGHVSDAPRLRDALAYWQSVGDHVEGITAQLRAEATLAMARGVRNGDGATEPLLKRSSLRLPNQRCLRYATHGLHEYRGKFFPQLVRALMNIARLPRDAIVLDPMCGSGTTLVEARLSGRKAYGLDMNPLSVFVTDLKCRALSLRSDALTSAYGNLRTALNNRKRYHAEPGYFAELARSDQRYLERWFAPRTLIELDCIDGAIRHLPDKTLRQFYRVCLSNILRRVSWQKNDDLRVRRSRTELADGETVARFLDEAARSTSTVAAFVAARRRRPIGRHVVREADARQASSALPKLIGKVDAVITSPPYATALPYIDTDRLSLIYLGLLSQKSHRQRDTLMIGNREVTVGRRKEYWQSFVEHKRLLPRMTGDMIERINCLNQAGDVGFRRRNLPALLSKYFFDMREAIMQARLLLKPGGVMCLVVGNNRTTAGGQKIEIHTADHLAAIARGIGFQLKEEVPMDMLISRDIFRKNAMPSERIMSFEKP